MAADAVPAYARLCRLRGGRIIGSPACEWQPTPAAAEHSARLLCMKRSMRPCGRACVRPVSSRQRRTRGAGVLGAGVLACWRLVCRVRLRCGDGDGRRLQPAAAPAPAPAPPRRPQSPPSSGRLGGLFGALGGLGGLYAFSSAMPSHQRA